MSFQHFGVMLDCSRDAVMRPDEVKKFITYIARMGYNTLELYTEDTYEVKEEPYFGYLRGKYTAQEIKEIDAFAAAHGVELIPCIQTLGHFSVPYKTPAYDSMWDVTNVLMIGEERTYEFIERLIKSCAESFTSRNINIGMDEAFMLGLGRYKKKHGVKKTTDLMLEHLQKVAAIAKKYGFHAHMWSDMFFRPGAKSYCGQEGKEIPESFKKQLPENISLAYWDYQTDKEEIYDEMFSVHKSLHRDVWYAGAAWTWCGFAPLQEYSFKALLPALNSVQRNGVEHVLITMWGDGGKECSFYSHLATLFAVKKYADGERDFTKIKAQFQKEFGLSYDDFMLLQLPNFTEKTNYGTLSCLCRTALYQDCFLGVYDEDIRSEGNVPFADVAKKLRAAAKRAGEFSYVFTTLATLCEALEYKAFVGIRLRDAYKNGDKKELARQLSLFPIMQKRVKAFARAFEALWEKENKPFGWEIHSTRLGGLLGRIEYCRRKLERYVNGEIDRIEELEEAILPYGYPEEIKFGENRYSYLISRSIL